MKNPVLSLLALLVLLSYSCDNSNHTLIKGVFAGGSGQKIYLEKLETNKTLVIDSAVLKSNGSFKFKLTSDYPDIFILKNTRGRFLTVLPFPGEIITIEGDYETPGKEYKLKGSEESEKVRVLNEKLSDTKQKLRSLDSDIQETASLNDAQALEYLNKRKEIIKEQRDFSIRFIIENMKSISGIYALYQTLDNEVLVLGENRDIQYMKILADSLSVAYPEVPIVKTFVSDARSSENKYYNLLGLSRIMGKATDNIPEIELPDDKGKVVRLSSLKGKVVLLYFWASFSAASRDQNPMLNNIYQNYKNKGFEVYAVSLDNKIEDWERAIRFDELNWINVCELRYPDSSVAALYNISNLPVNFLINKDGNILARDLYGKELEKWLSNLL